MASRESFVEIVGSLEQALAFEQQALSIGSEHMPEIARRVRDGETVEGEDLSGYWRWIIGQWVEMEDRS